MTPFRPNSPEDGVDWRGDVYSGIFRTGVWVSGKRHTEPVCGQTDGDTAVNLDVQVWQETV